MLRDNNQESATGPVKSAEEQGDTVTDLIMTVFVEQPLALPGPAKKEGGVKEKEP